MNENTDIAWLEEPANAIQQESVSAAKLHVLALSPIKEKLGTKWPRVSELVHKLFESALVRVQGPSDFFIRLDELSYAVVFRNLSFADANVVCLAIANDVCRALFGDKVDEVSVRSVIGTIPLPPGESALPDGKAIEALLERSGIETVVTQSVQSDPGAPIATLSGRVLTAPAGVENQIKAAHSRLAEHGLRVGFFPVWELQHEFSNSLFLAPFSGSVEHFAAIGWQSLRALDAAQIVDVEIVLLNAVAAYARRISDDQKVCAVGVGVSYDTMSRLQSRVRYITALQKIHLLPSTPLILKIEQIPEGTPAARIGELSAMMRLPNIRVTLEFESLRALPRFEFRLSALGLGGTIPANIDHDAAARMVKGITAAAALQKAFVFLDRLDSDELVQLARQNHVRFGTGTGLGTQWLSGMEGVPEFPLLRVTGG